MSLVERYTYLGSLQTGDGTYCNILADLNRDILVKSLRCVPGQGSDIIEKVNSVCTYC